MKRIWLSANSYDEAYEEIEEQAEEILDAFLSDTGHTITIEYGKRKEFSRDGYDVDYDCTPVGEFDLEWGEFLDVVGKYEMLDLLRGGL